MKQTVPLLSLEDAEFGEIKVRTNGRATGFTFRCAEAGLLCTSPIPYREQGLRDAIDQLRPRLRKLMERGVQVQQQRCFDADTRMETPCFRFWLEEARVSRMQVRQRKGELVCYYPAGQQWADERVQTWLRQMVEESLRMHAKVLFPPRLMAFARQRGLDVRSVSIHKTRGRWGSCSGKGNINLSLFLMLVPPHLQDYVMHHELTHLLEMNHGPRFWALLDEAVGGSSRQLREELRKYHTFVP